jgi:hypothetical protein
MRRASLLAIVLVAALVLAGCGGGGGGKTALSKAEFVSQANAICKDFQARIDKLGAPSGVEDLVTLAGKAIPISEEGVAGLRALQPPAELQVDVDAWLATGDVNVAKLKELLAAAKKKDLAAISKISDAGQANSDQAKQLASKLGLTECAKA